MPWFRRRKNTDEDVAAAPETGREPEPALTEPAAPEAAATTDPSRPAAKRRRGSRGGRGRKKTGAGAAATADAGEEKAERPEKSGRAEKAEPKKPRERKQLSQRQERRREQGRRRREPPRRAPLPAAKRELIVSVDVGEKRVAVLEDDKVAEVYLERPERRSIAGNIYLGTVDNVLPGMEAAFVEIGLEKNGFLYVDEIVGPEIEKGHGRKIQDLISRGQTILVQAVKDPMKTKGARLTTQISLPGRFVVFVPQGEGLGVSRRLEDDERNRLKDILKRLAVKEGGVIVRTAAEGASEEDIERDLVFLQRLWKSIEAKAKDAKAPELIYQEAELPLRVTRDLFTGDFEKAYVDDDRTHKRIVGYLKKTSPHMVERVVRYKDSPPLMEAFGVDAEIKSTLNRRVDLPSGGYLVFDYAEAFTVIDVNTGRFVGGRGKNSGARLEDTITKNNLEAVKEVVRQLRLRDIGGIIVIDFIDMANPKNRATVEEALRTELERDRTKTYVVEISPLGLVEMTRQNVTDGPREVMTRKCPTCGGDGIVYSEASAAIDVERRLRTLAAGSRSQAFRVELADTIAAALVGPGARRLLELESLTKKKFFLEGKPQTHADHFVVLAEGKLADLAPAAPVEEGAEVMLQLVEVDRHDASAAVGKLDGLDVVVADGAGLVGKRLKVRVERVLDGTAYGVLSRKTKAVPEPLTAEAEAEKPTRKPPARKAAAGEASSEAVDADDGELEAEAAETAETVVEAPEAEGEEPAEDEAGDAVDGEAPKPKKKTRRGSRGGRKRKKPATAAASAEGEAAESADAESADAEAGEPEPAKQVTIHVPGDDLGRPEEAEPGEQPVATGDPEPAAAAAEDEAEDEAETGEDAPKPKKKTRRGSRGGRRRKKPAAASANGGEPEAEEPEAEQESETDAEPEPEPEPESEPAPAPAPAAEEPSQNGDGEDEQQWGYVPMSEWLDEIDSGR
ncbi:MAG TPA: Rne/Rng family ribonuclease [Gaiellaceae bacterium]|nr:Rne/Rng family ribonuclease [Gaiellaceae bacterium]